MAYFYNQSTRTYIVAFSKLLSNIHVKRIDSADQEIKDLKVPLVYASKNKLSYMLQRNPDSDAASLVLPAIGFVIGGLQFDPQRKMSSLNQITVEPERSIYEGMPWNYSFQVTIKTKYQDDFWQILEQILYYFKPDVTLDVKELAYADYVRDVQVTLLGADLNNELEMDQESQRSFEANLDFVLKGYIYPSAMDDHLIEHVDVDFINNLNEEILNISHDWVGPELTDVTTTITEY